MLPPLPPPLPQSTIPYNPKVRMTPPTSVMIPLSPEEVEMYKDNRYRGRGATQIARSAKRKRSEEPPESEVDHPPTKRLAGDVGVVVNHCEFSLPIQIHDTNVSKTILVRTWGSYSVLNHL
jgi:mRNA (guanine-N7-)-methyltransferase